MDESRKIAVIGGGIAGLALAGTLTNKKVSVTLFEQDAHVGGRLLSQEFESASVDLGAQYFTAREEPFIHRVENWMKQGFCHLWDFTPYTFKSGQLLPSKDSTTRYVGLPSNQAISMQLAQELPDVRPLQTIKEVRSIAENKWQLISTQQVIDELYDWVIFATPPATTKNLNPSQELNSKIDPDFLPGFSLALWSSIQIQPQVEGVFVHDNPISWISQNSAKPNRALERGSCWLIQSNPHWAARHINDPIETVKKSLTSKFFDIFKITDPQIIKRDYLYQWQLAKSQSEPVSQGFLIDTKSRVGICGDWLLGGRVEGGYMSGYKLAQALLEL